MRSDSSSHVALSVRAERRVDALTVGQLLLGLWLLASPFLLDGVNRAVGVKDVVSGLVVVGATVVAVLVRSARRWDAAVSAGVGALLVLAALALEFGAGEAAAARQWNEVVVGVLLVCVAAARGR
jgi:hypothetical protein